jgi:outer membrane receptor protein involved in Fe transport
MNQTLTRSALALCLAAGAQASAQSVEPASGKVVLTGALLVSQGSARSMTSKASGGYAMEAGYQFAPKDYGVEFLVYGGWKKLPAANPAPGKATYQLDGPYAGFDVVYKPWKSLPLTLTTGPSTHVWGVTEQGVPDGRKGDRGLKLAWRAGLGYDLNDAWSLGLKYTQSEWRSTPDEGIAPSRPAYLSLTASYRF